MGKEKEICGTVRGYFSAHKITMKKAAEMLGVSTGAVTNQLSGRKFTANMAEKYANTFGFSEDFLLFGTGDLFGKGTKQEASVEIPEPIAQTLSSMSATILSQQQTIARLLSDKKNAAPRITAEGNAH